MRKAVLFLFFIISFQYGHSQAQSFTFACTHDTSIACSLGCFTLFARIPDLHGSSNSYNVNPLSVSNGCYNPYVAPDVPGISTALNIDDVYSGVIDIGFPFVFFGQTYTQLLASANGYLSFDVSKAGLFSHYQIYRTAGGALGTTGTPLDLPSTLYDKGLIMGPYHDLDPAYTTSPSHQIKYDTVGVAPYRKWILSFYKVPLFDCSGSISNTSHIVLYESTGIVEVFVGEQQICNIWQSGKAMIGMQDFARVNAVMAPNRKASDPAWGTVPMNESWRFVPAEGPSLFKRVKLYSLSGTLLAIGDTVNIGNGELQAKFQNVCPATNATTKVIVKTYYQKIDDPGAEIVGTDTINVIRNAGPVTASATGASCVTGQGTVTVSSPLGPTYEYSIDSLPWQNSNIFPGVAAGVHTVTARLIGTQCSSSTTVTITNVNTLTATSSTFDAACNGSASGTIVINASLGTPPYTYSLDGGPYQVSNTFNNVLSGNHTAIVKDAGGCTFTVNNIFVANGSGVTASATVVNEACPGAANGSITVNPQNGMAPFSYSINGGPFQVSNVFSGLPAGNYSITVKDATGCTGTVNKTVGSGAGFTATAVATPSGCTPSGTITVTPTPPATGPFTYSLDGGAAQASNIFSGVAGGSHTVVVTQASTCTFTITPIIVASNSSISATADSTSTECSGAFTGTINVIASNGVPPYLYKIDGGAFQPGGLFSGLAAGNHTITVQDNSGCSITFIKGVAVGAGAHANASSTNTACSSASNGTITVTPDIGISPFVFKIDLSGYQASNVFTGLTSGAHNITVKDSAGCTYTFVQNIIANPGVSATTTSTTTACSGASTGTITVTASNGIPAYQYKINAGAYQLSNVFSGLATGTYTITVKDSAGCTFPVIQVVTAGQGVTATATPTNTACTGVSTGTLTVNPTGVAPYTFNIDGGVFQASNVFSALAAGSHTIIVRDAAGCSFSFQQSVGANPGVDASIIPTNTACASASNGTITINPTAGASPFTFSIDGGALVPGNVFINLAAGLHNVFVRDATGCTLSVSQAISANAGVTAFADTTNTACATATTGSITVHPSAGIAPYSYKINGGIFQASNLFTGLPVGTYTLVVKDSAGCTYTFTQNIAANAGVVADPATIGNAGCPGSSTGVIYANAHAGIQPYKYSINGGAFQFSNTFSALAAGMYTIAVKDSAGCTSSISATVGTNPLVTANPVVVQPGCFGTASGSITVNASLGIPPYTYALNAGPFQANQVFNNLIAGSYTLHIKDATNCSFDTLLNLTQPALFAVSDTTIPATCNGNDGVIMIFATGGTSPFQYSVNGGATYGNSSSIVDSIGSYNIRIKDANGCTADTFAVISLDNTMTLTLPPDTTVCVGSNVVLTPSTNPQTNVFNWSPAGGALNQSTGAYTVSPADSTPYVLIARWGVCQDTATVTVNVLHKPVANAGLDTIICDRTFAILRGMASNLSGSVKYLWTPAGDIAQPDTSVTTVSPKTNGQHVYTLEVDDSYGCNFKVFDKVLVTMNSPVPAFAGRDTIAAMDLPHQLYGSGGINYLWTSSPPASLNDPTKKNPIATLHSDTRFVLTVTDNGGCVGTDTVFIKVYKGPTYYIPNAFSPNGDGVNDIFRAIPPGITSTEYFRIFNRWGQMVFETHDYLKGWDGTYIGKPQPAGAYVWIIKGIDKFGKPVEMRGTVMLIR